MGTPPHAGHSMILKLAIALSFLCAPLLGDHSHPEARLVDPTAPKYKIDVRKQETLEMLARLDDPHFSIQHPYAKIRPQPFYYMEDWAVDHEKAFLIAGVNCDSVIKNIKSITGVSMEYLDKRAHAPEVHDPKYDPKKEVVYPYISTARDLLPAWWKESGNVGFRASSDGFVTKEQQLRQLLLADNEQVRKMGLNHQKIAEPILTAIEELYRMPGKRGRPETFTFNFSGHAYTVNVGPMLPGTWHDDGPASDAHERKRQEYESRVPQTGWVGSGVQGSFFNDEIFTDLVLNFTRKSDGKKFSIDGMTPHLIYRYGFYQGGQYRVGPKEIAQFFNVKGDPENSGFEKCTKD